MKISLNKAGLGLMILAFSTIGCAPGASNSASSVSAVADESASGAAASAAGGALSNSESSGTQAAYQAKQLSRGIWAVINKAAQGQTAQASNSCPTFRTTGSGCAVSGSNMWLSYSSCEFAGAAEWSGVQEISMSSGTAACGTFPEPPASGTLYRQFVQASGASTPGTATIIADAMNATIDDASANLANFDNQTVSSIHNGGYGAAISFDSNGTRSAINVAQRIYVTGAFDHSVVGNLSISEASGATSRTISGSVTVYHNKLKVVGTSTFSNVVHEDICCLPVSGTITTDFAAGMNVSPTVDGSALVGKSESLQFTGCGTAVYTSAAGAVSNVVLHRCF